jgi:hypothetical protein
MRGHCYKNNVAQEFVVRICFPLWGCIESQAKPRWEGPGSGKIFVTVCMPVQQQSREVDLHVCGEEEVKAGSLLMSGASSINLGEHVDENFIRGLYIKGLDTPFQQSQQCYI